MTVSATAICLDCGFEKEVGDQAGIDAKTRANRIRGGHLNKRGCHNAIVVTDREQWWLDRGWVPAGIIDEVNKAERGFGRPEDRQ